MWSGWKAQRCSLLTLIRTNARNLSNRSRLFNLGDFPEDQAKAYLQSVLQAAPQPETVCTDQELQQLVDVVGGRVLDLDTCGKDTSAYVRV